MSASEVAFVCSTSAAASTLESSQQETRYRCRARTSFLAVQAQRCSRKATIRRLSTRESEDKVRGVYASIQDDGEKRSIWLERPVVREDEAQVADDRADEEDRGTGRNARLPIRVGDLAVHETYGVGRFVGVEYSSSTLFQGGVRELAVLEYNDGDLFVPMTQLDRLRPVGNVDGVPRVDSMCASSAFSDTQTKRSRRARTVGRERQKARKQILDLHGLYAARAMQKREAIRHVNEQAELAFDASFDNQLTSDQSRALEDIFQDLCERNQPMDRLLCGDVGFGKTEVALRAALRVVLGGRQVILLCPTTVLAAQHYHNAVSRLSCLHKLGLDVKVGRLSRFVSKAEQAETRQRAADGEVQLLIATHALLWGEIRFRHLGLVIVDEEHRFGVRQKDQLRNTYRQVDVLSLSATPIPRTLHLTMCGLRDVSLLREAPVNRRAIITRVAPQGNGWTRRAIGAELARGGQTYYVVRHVEGIESRARWIRSLFPHARVLVAHGQMKDLEKRMHFFADGRADVLVCTTIIENGIDIARANTILVEDSSAFGLAQLHQLRGRVGRSNMQAFAYLLHEGDETILHERLRTLQMHSELGGGYIIAQRDLEMRGVGTVLGIEQSGKQCTLEPDNYARLLAEEILLATTEELKVAPPLPNVATTTMYLPVDFLIPSDYIRDDELRFDAYTQLAYVRDVDALHALQRRLERIYGSPAPLKMQQYCRLIEVKVLAQILGISRICIEREHVVLEWEIAARTMRFLVAFLEEEAARQRFEAQEAQSRVVLRGGGMMSGDVLVAKLCTW